MSTKKKILIGVGVFVALIVIAAVLAIVFTSGDKKQATQFVQDVASGNKQAAYDQFSGAAKDSQDFDTFSSQVDSLGLDGSCKLEVSGVEASTSTGNTITGSVKCDDGSHAASFVYKDGKIVSYRIDT